ncbi:MAG: response regulator [Spirochaetales bacterium]|nr:response regulator [Spirochaetales bacterium]
MEDKPILIVEDEIIFSLFLKMELMDFGFKKVETASSIPRALNLIEIFEPELLIMDVNLRDNADGIDLSKEIRKRLNREIPVIFISGEHQNNINQRLEAEMADSHYLFLSKPIREKELIQTIESFIREVIEPRFVSEAV